MPYTSAWEYAIGWTNHSKTIIFLFASVIAVSTKMPLIVSKLKAKALYNQTLEVIAKFMMREAILDASLKLKLTHKHTAEVNGVTLS